MTTLESLTHSFIRRAAAAVIAIIGMAAGAGATTIGPGNALQATFTTVPNTADMILFFDNTPYASTGTPVITVQLFDGAGLLGTYTGDAFSGFISSVFTSPTSLFTTFSPTQVDFTSINNGSIQGRLLMTVTGGTITFNVSDLVLSDGLGISSTGYSPRPDVQNISFAVVSDVPEPTSVMLMAPMLLVGVYMARKRNLLTHAGSSK